MILESTCRPCTLQPRGTRRAPLCKEPSLDRIAVIAALALCACGPQTVGTTNRAQIAQRVLAQHVGWTRFVNNRSLDSLGSYYLNAAELTVVWPDGERTRGWDPANRKWKRWADSLTQLNFVSEDLTVEVVGRDAGLATFRTRTDAVIGSSRTTTFGRVIQVWVRDPADGRWKIAAEQRSDLLARP